MMQRKYICKDIYSVNSGDTLYTIAQLYRVPVGLLMRANKITNPYNLRVGMQLCIPGLEGIPLKKTPKETKKPTAEKPNISTETDATETEELEETVIIAPEEDGILLYSIAAGDTLYMIAKKHRVTLQALMDANPDMDPYNLIIGARIRIPLSEPQHTS